MVNPLGKVLTFLRSSSLVDFLLLLQRGLLSLMVEVVEGVLVDLWGMVKRQGHASVKVKPAMTSHRERSEGEERIPLTDLINIFDGDAQGTHDRFDKASLGTEVAGLSNRANWTYCCVVGVGASVDGVLVVMVLVVVGVCCAGLD